MAEHVPLGTDINVGEEGEHLDTAILIKGIISHVDIALTNSLTLDTTEMDGLLLQVVLHNINNQEPVHGKQVFICCIPNSTSSRRRVVQVHTGLLQSLVTWVWVLSISPSSAFGHNHTVFPRTRRFCTPDWLACFRGAALQTFPEAQKHVDCRMDGIGLTQHRDAI